MKYLIIFLNIFYSVCFASNNELIMSSPINKLEKTKIISNREDSVLFLEAEIESLEEKINDLKYLKILNENKSIELQNKILAAKKKIRWIIKLKFYLKNTSLAPIMDPDFNFYLNRIKSYEKIEQDLASGLNELFLMLEENQNITKELNSKSIDFNLILVFFLS